MSDNDWRLHCPGINMWWPLKEQTRAGHSGHGSGDPNRIDYGHHGNMLQNISLGKADTYLNMCYILKVYSIKVVVSGGLPDC